MSDEASEVESTDDGLTDKQRRFVDAYMGAAKCNATQAARMAGYEGSDATLANTAYRLMRKGEIRKALNVRIEADPLIMGRAERLRELTRIARREITVKDVDQNTGEVVEVPVVAIKDAIAAMKDLAMAQGDHITKVEHTGKDGSPIQSETRLNVLSAEGANAIKSLVLLPKK